LEDETLDPESQTEESPEPNEKLVMVFETNDESEALVVKGLLESDGLEVLMSTREAPVGVFPISSTHLGDIRLLVRAELADGARRLIDDSEVDIPEAERTKDSD